MDRPILFSAPMVRALLEERKTQTRRIAKFIEPIDDGEFHIHNAGGGLYGVSEADVPAGAVDYAPIAVGDRLWVREAWRMPSAFDEDSPSTAVTRVGPSFRPNVFYEADGGVRSAGAATGKSGRLRASMHMPRWASRLTLTVTDVRVQRLQDISSDDALAEGINPLDWVLSAFRSESTGDGTILSSTEVRNYVPAFARLWKDINGAGSWDANPWVAAYTFTVERRNIDARSSSVEG